MQASTKAQKRRCASASLFTMSSGCHCTPIIKGCSLLSNASMTPSLDTAETQKVPRHCGPLDGESCSPWPALLINRLEQGIFHNGNGVGSMIPWRPLCMLQKGLLLGGKVLVHVSSERNVSSLATATNPQDGLVLLHELFN